MSKVKIEACLVRGNTYYLSEKRFDYGNWVEVTAEQADHLKKHAVDHRTIPATADTPAEDISFQKFRFQETAEEGKPSTGPDDEQPDKELKAEKAKESKSERSRKR